MSLPECKRSLDRETHIWVHPHVQTRWPCASAPLNPPVWACTGLTFEAVLKPVRESRTDTEPDREAANTFRCSGASFTTALVCSVCRQRHLNPHSLVGSPLPSPY